MRYCRKSLSGLLFGFGGFFSYSAYPVDVGQIPADSRSPAGNELRKKMKKEFDLFERLPDGSPMWRGHVSDIADIDAKLSEVARKTPNECFALHLPTKQIVRRMNGSSLPNFTGDAGPWLNFLER